MASLQLADHYPLSIFLSNVNMRNTKNGVLTVVLNHLVSYPTPMNISYLYGFGSLAGICLGIQIITGVFLAMNYVPMGNYAFMSVEHIMRDLNYGWFIRYTHANGSSMFFLLVYIHIARGLYYGSYVFPRHMTWITGVVIFILMMATAFLGYVLPWGQMSFWAATVITNLFSAIPLIGPSIVEWLWGGFSIGSPTLNRFFSLHFLLPFAIAAFVGIHLAFLHKNGSNNPLTVDSSNDSLPFFPYFVVKDVLGFQIFLFLFSVFIFFAPNVLGHPDNYVYADSLSTPLHIVPEWYFLPFYAILRSIPDKLGGVICMGLALVVLIFLPFLYFGKTKGAVFNPTLKVAFWIFASNVVFLGWLGQKVMEPPYQILGAIATFIYFFYFVLIAFIK
jgi:quinol-cytochrome oxidoreductase complex cytochrome b subunit